MADVSVRPAVPSDAAAIAHVQSMTWQTAYGDVLPTEALTLDVADVESAWSEAISRAPSPHHRVLVAVDGDELVGFAACEPATDYDLESRAAELTALLVEPRWGRRGHGSRLLAAAVDLWREESVDIAVTWVFETDAVVSGFLTSAGWGPDTVGRALGEAEQRRWHTSL